MPPHGPLVDMFGPGTVFHYIRTRQRQIRKAKAASKQTSIIQKSVKSQTMTTVTGTSDDEVSHQIINYLKLPQFLGYTVCFLMPRNMSTIL